MPIKKKSISKSTSSSKRKAAASSSKKGVQGVKHQSLKVGASYIGETEKRL